MLISAAWLVAVVDSTVAIERVRPPRRVRAKYPLWVRLGLGNWRARIDAEDKPTFERYRRRVAWARVLFIAYLLGFIVIWGLDQWLTERRLKHILSLATGDPPRSAVDHPLAPI